MESLHNCAPSEKKWIVAVTADVFESTTSELLNAGVNQVLPKPTKLTELGELCDRLFNNVVNTESHLSSNFEDVSQSETSSSNKNS